MRSVAVAVVALAFLCGAAPAAAEILTGDSDDRLWLISDDGTTRTRVGTTNATEASWAPDGERFVAVSFLPRNRSQLVIGRVGTAELVALPGSVGLRDPAWSPDGQTIAASRSHPRARDDDPFAADLVLLPASGGEPRVLAGGGAYYSVPAWSPDGSELAVTRAVFDPERGFVDGALVAIHAGTGAQRPLASHGGDASWSPDGRQIVFASGRDRNGQTCFHDCTPNGELYVVGADGAGERRLTVTETNEDEPAWSPDGTRIAFGSDRHYPRGRSDEIFVMDVDGSCVTQLTFGPRMMYSPQWRPGRVPVGRGPCGVRLAPYFDDVDLARARVRHARTLFVGRSFEGMLLTHADRGLLVYDECELPDPARCPGELQLQTATTCDRHPAKYDIPGHLLRMRGALLVDYHDHVDILSGGTTTTVFQIRSRARLRRIVAALRPIRGPEGLGKPLPPPRLSRKTWRSLRRSAQVRRDPIILPRREMIRFDRRVLRAMRRFGSKARPACDR